MLLPLWRVNAAGMIWETPHGTFNLNRRALIMGVVNVTTDSFSDGGQFIEVEAAVAQALRLVDQGAEIIDVGGESTRPGAQPMSEEEELRRVLPVVERLAGQTRFVVSIDTMKAGVARAAVEHGAAIVNDVTGLRNAAMRDVVKATGAAAIAMHMQGEPRTMQRAPHYDDVCAEVRVFFRQIFDACLRSEINPMRLAFDPGIGFGKKPAHNLALIRNLDELRVADRPLVLGVSRKSFIGKVLGSEMLADREWPTVALTSYGRARGAQVFRVHEARANAEALRMTEAILNSEPAA